MTIQIPDGGPPFDAELVDDEFTILSRHQAKSRGQRMASGAALGCAHARGGASCARHPRSRRCSRRTGSAAGGCNEADRCPMLSEVAMSPPAPRARR